MNKKRISISLVELIGSLFIAILLGSLINQVARTPTLIRAEVTMKDSKNNLKLANFKTKDINSEEGDLAIRIKQNYEHIDDDSDSYNDGLVRRRITTNSEDMDDYPTPPDTIMAIPQLNSDEIRQIREIILYSKSELNTLP